MHLKLCHDSKDFVTKDSAFEDFKKRVAPSTLLEKQNVNVGMNVFLKLGSILTFVPFYELFEKRISVFEHEIGQPGLFYVFRVKGDTSRIAETIKSATF